MSGLHEEHLKGRVFLKRLFFVVPITLVLVIILILRLFYLQIIEYNYFITRSENNRIKIKLIPPLRGNFLDRNNHKLTENRNSYDVFLYQNKNNKDVIKKISTVLSIDDENVKKIDQILSKNRYMPIVQILNHLTWEDLVKLESNMYDLEGIVVEEGNIRNYLYDEEFSHIIGYISNPNEKEIKILSKRERKEILLNPNYRIGKTGLEKKYNDDLMIENGYKKMEVNVLGIPLRNLEIKKPVQSEDIKLTIDLELQKFVYNLLKDKRGTAIVLNVKTGEILSMVSTPSFKSNEFVTGVNKKYWNELLSDEKKPLLNKAISALYSPGSTFKPLVALSALENGWDENKKIACVGRTFFGPREFRCWKKEGHGYINIKEAIQHSCNIYFAELSASVGIDLIYETAKDFGIGEVFDIGLDNYKKGILPNKEWKKKYLHDVWVRGDTINVGIGQGFLLVNPLQLSVMVSRIANGGYPIVPFLNYNGDMRNYNKSLFKKKSKYSAKNINIVKEGMYMVMNKKGGTGFFNRILKKEFEMAGKTGTAQVIALDTKNKMGDDNKELIEKFRHHALFVGFAPYNDPKYGIAVVIEHGDGGSISALPIAKQILEFAQEKNI